MEISRIAKNNCLNPRTLEKQYKETISDFPEWKKSSNPKELIFPQNFGRFMSIDETALSKGELYTVITNKDAHGRKGSLAALIEGTKGEIITTALEKVPIGVRMKVQEVWIEEAAKARGK